MRLTFPLSVSKGQSIHGNFFFTESSDSMLSLLQFKSVDKDALSPLGEGDQGTKTLYPRRHLCFSKTW